MVLFKQYQLLPLAPIWWIFLPNYWKFIMFYYSKLNTPKSIVENEAKYPQYKTIYMDWCVCLGFFGIKRKYSEKRVRKIMGRSGK